VCDFASWCVVNTCLPAVACSSTVCLGTQVSLGYSTTICKYWHDKGLATILVGRLLNLTALAFTICFSGFLLLAVNWHTLTNTLHYSLRPAFFYFTHSLAPPILFPFCIQVLA
jgi:hypothetical protein